MLYVSDIVYYKRRGFDVPRRSWSMFNRWLSANASAPGSEKFQHWVMCWGLAKDDTVYLRQCKNGCYRITGRADNILALASFYELSVHAVVAFAYNYFINFVLDSKIKK